MGFPFGSSDQQACTKIGKRQLYTKGKAIHKTIQKRSRKQIFERRKQNKKY
jgi:hypothetical protein